MNVISNNKSQRGSAGVGFVSMDGFVEKASQVRRGEILHADADMDVEAALTEAGSPEIHSTNCISRRHVVRIEFYQKRCVLSELLVTV